MKAPKKAPMKAVTLAALALALLPSATLAETRQSIGIICKFDIQQYCKDIRKTRIRELKECLGKHEKDLFPRCQNNYKTAK
jgi:hypothetical protein